MRPKVVTPVKASESVVSRMLAKLLRVSPSDELLEVCNTYVESGINAKLVEWIDIVYELYPWVTDVARDVMSDKTTPFTEHLMAMPTSVFIVKDSERSGLDSLWMAVGDPSIRRLESLRALEHRGLTRTFRLEDDDLFHVIAIQLNSCKP